MNLGQLKIEVVVWTGQGIQYAYLYPYISIKITYTYISLHIHTYPYVSIHNIHTYIYIHTHTYIYIHTDTSIYPYVYIYIYVSMYISHLVWCFNIFKCCITHRAVAPPKEVVCRAVTPKSRWCVSRFAKRRLRLLMCITYITPSEVSEFMSECHVFLTCMCTL